MWSAYWPSAGLKHIIGAVVVVIQFLIPLFILLYCSGKILWVLTKRIDSNFSKCGPQSDTFQVARTNSIKTLLLVVLCFIICWSNNQIYYLMFHLGYAINFSSTYYKFTVLMVFLNCTVNPFIYLIKYKDYQDALRKLFGCSNQKHGNDSEIRQSNVSGSVSTNTSI